MRMLIATAAALLMSAAAAYASPVTVDGSYTLTYTATNGNGPGITDDLLNPFTESLTVGTPTTAANFFTLSPAGSSGTGGYGSIASGTVTATFSFTTPSGATGDFIDTGTYQAKYGGSSLRCSTSGNGDTDCLDWSSSNNPIQVTFSDGSILSINLINASDWNITPTLTFDLTNGPTQSVPTPTSLALFGTALAGLGLFAGMRRRWTL